MARKIIGKEAETMTDGNTSFHRETYDSHLKRDTRNLLPQPYV